MSKEEFNRLQNETRELEGYISYLRTKKLSRGLTEYEIRVYESKKAEFKSLSARLHDAKETQKLIMTA